MTLFWPDAKYIKFVYSKNELLHNIEVYSFYYSIMSLFLVSDVIAVVTESVYVSERAY